MINFINKISVASTLIITTIALLLMQATPTFAYSCGAGPYDPFYGELGMITRSVTYADTIADADTDTYCGPALCDNAKYVDAGIWHELRFDNGAGQRYVINNRNCLNKTILPTTNAITSGSLKSCRGPLSTPCSPNSCGVGEIEAGIIEDKYPTPATGSSDTDLQRTRICLSGVQSAHITSCNTYDCQPPACNQGEYSHARIQDVGRDGEVYYRLCMAFAPPPTTTSSTTTTTIPDGGTTTTTTLSGGPTTTLSGTTTTASGATTTTIAGATTTAAPTTTTLATATTAGQIEIGAGSTTTTAVTGATAEEAIAAIQDANQTIVASQATKNVTAALELYTKAIDSYNAADYSNAKSLALQSKSSVKDFEQPKATEIPILYIAIGAIAILAALGGVVYFMKMKKGSATESPPQQPQQS